MVQGPFRTRQPLVLASTSPRRQALLAGLGLAFEVIPSSMNEPSPEPGENPADYAARMARLKGMDVAARHPDKFIVSADTIVVQGLNILGKPKDKFHALAMLTALSGDWHEVMTGFCVLRARGNIARCQTETTRVHMATNSREMLTAYVASGEPMDKAGAYGIQGIGAFLVDTIEGSYTNVVGLPLRSVLNILLEVEAIGVVDAQHLAQVR
ncbi:MAG: septum formation protein Maf [Deltaproteobacteria bacterium]|nr:septum formation protein Maf [Deltaproteobacteria bacterium]